MKGADKTKEFIETLTKAEKKKLLEAAESVDNFKGGLFVIVFLAVFFSIIYGVYCVGYQEGRHEGIKEVVKYNQCAYKTTSLSDADECWDKEVTNHAS